MGRQRRVSYGRRVCVECGAEFEAGYASQVTCGAGCQDERDRKKRALCDRRRKRERRVIEGTFGGLLEWLNCRYEGALGEIRERDRRIGELEERVAKLKVEVRKLVAERARLRRRIGNGRRGKEAEMRKDGMEVCERMHMRGTRLPCGEREECFLSPKCAMVPRGKTWERERLW